MATAVRLMALPIATTTIAVLRRTVLATDDPYEVTAVPAAVAEGVRAVIGAPSGNELVAGGSQEDVTHRLDCDTTDLRNTDQVRDETTSETFDVVWARSRTGLGLDHTVAGLRQVTGVV